MRTNGANRWILLFAAGALFLLSALSKETGIVFLLLWCAILLLKKRWKEFLPATVVALFVVVIYLSLRLPAEHVPAPTLRTPAPLLVRPIVAARAFAEYAGLILLPINLHMDRDVETHPEGGSAASANSAAWRELQTLLGILLAAGAVYWLMRSRKQDPGDLWLPCPGRHRLSASQRHFSSECDRRRALDLSADRVSLSRRGPGDFAIFNFQHCPRIGPGCLVPLSWCADLDPNL